MSDYNKIKIGIINLKINNIYSIYQACKNIGYNTRIVSPRENKYTYDVLILPGDGAFMTAMRFMRYNGIDQKIYEFLQNKNKRLMGICLGMQLLFDKSEEFGNCKGLGLIKGDVKKIIKKKNILLPHIGWNKIILSSKKNNFITKKNNNKYYYFIHSFYCLPREVKNVSSYTKLGQFKFCSALNKDNIIATQFHPEKSGRDGLAILKNIFK